MSGFPPPPPGLDINESMQTNITAAIFITWAASLIFIALRFTARRLSKAGFWWDDWLILPAAVTSTASTWVTWSMMIRHGVGRHIWALPMPPDFTDFLKGLFIVEVLYTIELLLVKFSILAFYWRIFRVSSIKIPIYIIAFIVFGWAVGQECAIFLQSVPLNSIWDKSITPTSSINDFTFFYASAIPSIVTDFACLILPMPYIWKLQVSRAQKLGIMLMFALGSFVVAVSFIRLAYLVTQDLTSIDYFWNVTNGHIWSIVELNTAVISVTLPSLRPVYTWARTTPLLSYYGLLSKKTGTSGSGTGFSSKTPYNGSRSGTYGRHTAGNDDDPDDNTGLFSRLPSSELGSNTKVGFKNDIAVANDEVIEMEEGRGKSWPGVRVTSDVSVSYGKR